MKKKSLVLAQEFNRYTLVLDLCLPVSVVILIVAVVSVISAVIIGVTPATTAAASTSTIPVTEHESHSVLRNTRHKFTLCVCV